MMSPQLRAAAAQAEQARREWHQPTSGRVHIRVDRRPASRRVVAQRTHTTRTASSSTTSGGDPPQSDDDEPAPGRLSHRPAGVAPPRGNLEVLARVIAALEAVELADYAFAEAVLRDLEDELRSEVPA